MGSAAFVFLRVFSGEAADLPETQISRRDRHRRRR